LVLFRRSFFYSRTFLPTREPLWPYFFPLRWSPFSSPWTGSQILYAFWVLFFQSFHWGFFTFVSLPPVAANTNLPPRPPATGTSFQFESLSVGAPSSPCRDVSGLAGVPSFSRFGISDSFFYPLHSPLTVLRNGGHSFSSLAFRLSLPGVPVVFFPPCASVLAFVSRPEGAPQARQAATSSNMRSPLSQLCPPLILGFCRLFLLRFFFFPAHPFFPFYEGASSMLLLVLFFRHGPRV